MRLLAAASVLAWGAAALASEETPTLQLPESVRWWERLDVRMETKLSTPLREGEGRAGVAIELAPRPDYWYAVELVAGSESMVCTRMSSDGSFEHAVTRREGLLASARLFKRFGPLVLSGGIIDNHGGFAAELRASSDRLRLELMTYDLSLADPARLRVSGSAQWRWLFVQAGLQDVTDRLLRTPYVGAGLRWRDPDLKSVAFWLP